MPTFIVNKEINLSASPAQVWDALTNPEKTRHYFFHCRVYSDWKTGSPITFKGRMFLFFKIELQGTLLQVIPEKLLQYTLYSRDGSRSTVTDTISFDGAISTLHITDDVGQGEGAQKRFERSMKGWDKVLQKLKILLEHGF